MQQARFFLSRAIGGPRRTTRPGNGKRGKAARRDNPEVVWFKSHPRNHQKEASVQSDGCFFLP
jgi:hypothetical protein